MGHAERVMHTFRASGPVHAMDCQPCIELDSERAARYAETNLHRQGTKARRKREQEDKYMRYVLDMRYEHYWQN